MGQDTLDSLALLNFHLDKVQNILTVCDRFLAAKTQLKLK